MNPSASTNTSKPEVKNQTLSFISRQFSRRLFIDSEPPRPAYQVPTNSPTVGIRVNKEEEQPSVTDEVISPKDSVPQSTVLSSLDLSVLDVLQASSTSDDNELRRSISDGSSGLGALNLSETSAARGKVLRENTPSSPFRHPTPPPNESSTSGSPSNRPTPLVQSTGLGSQGCGNLTKSLHFFAREEGQFCVFTRTSSEILVNPPYMEDSHSIIPGSLFLNSNPEGSIFQVWIWTAQSAWKEGYDGAIHPSKAHRCLSIRALGGKMEANWVLLKTYQTYKQRELRREQEQKNKIQG